MYMLDAVFLQISSVSLICDRRLKAVWIGDLLLVSYSTAIMTRAYSNGFCYHGIARLVLTTRSVVYMLHGCESWKEQKRCRAGK